MRRSLPVAVAVATLSLPLAGRAEPPKATAQAAPAACTCADPEAPALRAALVDLTREVAKLREAMGGPFDGINGLRRETEGLRRDLDGLRSGMRDLERAVQSSRR
ncbi:MAG TPA: hypothetical protein VFP50_13740 [Anaeromyxobacteraceae bacterium]|nr:hypothetical protein [Anaeromyxobacteraceae bacterium]